jgi:hypothetical protein
MLVRCVLSCSLENRCLVDWLFRAHREVGFYVYVKWCVFKSRCVAGYVGCYLRYLAIVVSCVSEFDVEANMVTYWFMDEHRVRLFVMLYVFLFIERLVRACSG